MSSPSIKVPKRQGHNPLTKYKPASLMELWTIAWPLIIASLSGHCMLFVDRVLLAQYSLTSMNAAAGAAMAAWIFVCGLVSIASIAEVFAGQHNGANNTGKVVEPVWQMLLLSAATIAIFWPLALWGGAWLLPETLYSESEPYFRIIMLGGPLSPIFAAMAAFFTSIGKPKIITIASICANLANLILDYLLIFGHPGFIPPLGTTGAAVATIISQLLGVVIIASMFFNQHNRRKYGTHKPKLVLNSMLKCVRIGYPNALGHLLEMVAWYLLFYSTASLSAAYVTILTLGQTVYILFVFLFDGMHKAITAIAANLIGAQKRQMLHTLLRSAFRLHCILISILFVPLVLYPDLVLSVFVLTDDMEKTKGLMIIDQYITCYYVWFYCIFDGFLWVFAGLLTALTDTLFVMLANSIAAALLGVLPIYLLINYYGAPAYIIWGCLDIYACAALLAMALRYWWIMGSSKTSKKVVLQLPKDQEASLISTPGYE